MNDDLVTRLDERGRGAASAAHGAVAEHPIPEFDPDLVRVSLDDDPSAGSRGSDDRRGRRRVAGRPVPAGIVAVQQLRDEQRGGHGENEHDRTGHGRPAPLPRG